jgi:ATP-binding cassette, subfamily B, multidrug efflux pump
MVPKLMADLIDIGVTNSDVPYIINKGIQMAV